MDNLFLLAEEPNHLMTIAGCYRFAQPPRPADVEDTFQRLVDNFPRFGQRVRQRLVLVHPGAVLKEACLCHCALFQVQVTYGGFAYWEDMPSMDVRKHITRLPLVQ